MKRILVPTDFSKTANKARDYAIKLAELFDAEIILFNAYHVPHTGAGSGTFVNIDNIAKETAEEEMKEQKEYVQQNHPTLVVKYVCKYGVAVDSIKRICKNSAIDLVVMGTTGASGFVGNLLGSNTAALIGSTKTPIIAVPDEATISYPKNIVVANDLMESDQETVFNVLKEISEEVRSKIDFLFIIENEKETDKKIQRIKAANFDEAFDTAYHPFHFRNNENVEEGIFDFINKRNVDLLVVVSRERSFIDNLFHKSITKSLAIHTKVPLLILPE